VAVRAAVVTTFDSAPLYQEFPTPVPAGDDEMLVDVLAAGLYQRVRAQADGSHYTSTDELPLVPGIDGAGRGPDGRLRYFILPDTTMGSMAEQTVVDLRQSVVLPETVDPVAVAAAMNPAMSSWVALRRRVQFRAGQDVLILGATAKAGQMAVQIAKLFGANKIVAVGRNGGRLSTLSALGATSTVRLDGDPEVNGDALGKAAGDVDVVIDYLWGEPSVAAMIAVLTHRADRGKLLTWIEVGSVAGRTAPIPSAALRAARIQIVGSGQGSVSGQEYLAELPALAEEIAAGGFAIDFRAMPLSEVEHAWAAAADATQRIVFTPQS
jgi:NADPH:quinone reductase-like Zn-dependent oxidoreductase